MDEMCEFLFKWNVAEINVKVFAAKSESIVNGFLLALTPGTLF